MNCLSAWDFLNDPKLLVAQCTLIYQMGVHKENQIKARYIHIIQCNISDQWHVIYFSGIKSTPFIKIYGTLLLIPSLDYWLKISSKLLCKGIPWNKRILISVCYFISSTVHYINSRKEDPHDFIKLPMYPFQIPWNYIQIFILTLFT